MKKRIISLLLVALMLVSIAPFGAMAAFDLGDIDIPGIGGGTDSTVTITFTEQPKDVTVAVGETATFTVSAVTSNPLSKEIKYLWIDATEIGSGEKLSVATIIKIARMLKSDGTLPNSNTYTIDNVTSEHNGKSFKCIAYCGEFTLAGGKNLSYAISNKATLTVTGGVTPSPDPNPDPTDTPAPSETTTPSPSPSVKPEDCTHANPEHHAATENNTCDPHIEYWYCPDCGKYFKDAGCTQRVTKGKLDDGMTKDKNKHTDLKKVPSKAATCTEEGNIEHWYCSGCGNYYSDSKGTAKTTHANVTTKKADHDYYWVADEVANVHYEKCRVCGKTTGTSNHSGGTASCKAQAKCEKCGASYGELDATNHVKFEYKNAVKPTETTKGYTGDQVLRRLRSLHRKGHRVFCTVHRRLQGSQSRQGHSQDLHRGRHDRLLRVPQVP